jgi:flagellar biosynthetic protein FliR
LYQIDVERFLVFTLVLSRVSGLTMSAPIFGTRDVPMQVRALLAMAIAVMVMPTQMHIEFADPGTTLNYLTFIGGEVLIGLCLGVGVTVLFSGVQLGGQMMGRMGGLMLADVFDPNSGEQIPVFSRLLYLVAMAVFVTIGGHRLVMAALLDTFHAIPPGGGAVPSGLTEAFTLLLTQSFLLGMRASLPVVTALLLSTLVLGLIGRTMPQLNILIVGFGMNAMLTFALLAMVMGAAAWAFQAQVVPTLDVMTEVLIRGTPPP